MTTGPVAEVRARRPADHKVLMEELHTGDAPFPTYRDILLFAAAVGYTHNRRVSFTATYGDPIRYEVLTTPGFSDTLINMIAANAVAEGRDVDAEIMDSGRTEERLRIFEEYANGGLEYIQEQVNVRSKPAAAVVLELITDAFSDEGGAQPASVSELLDSLPWS